MLLMTRIVHPPAVCITRLVGVPSVALSATSFQFGDPRTVSERRLIVVAQDPFRSRTTATGGRTEPVYLCAERAARRG